MNTNEHKARAAAAGLDWPVVLAAYREARGLEAAELERIGDARRDAFRSSCGDDHGGRWKARNRAALNGGDATYIRGLDVTAADRGMTADELLDELAGDAVTMRPADDVMAETIDRLIELATGQADEPEYIGLVAAAALADVTEQWMRQMVKAGRIRGRKAGRNWQVCRADAEFFARHPTAGRPRFRAFQEAAPF
jgi:hypothetical protein